LRKILKSKVSITFAKVQWAISDKDRLKEVISYLKEHNDRLERLRPRNESGSKHLTDIAVACEALATTNLSAAIEDMDIDLPEELLLQFPGLRPLHQIMDMRKRQRDTEANVRTWTRYELPEIEQWEYKVSWKHSQKGPRRLQASYEPERDKASRRPVLLEWKYYAGDSSQHKNLATERVERVAQLLNARSKLPNCVSWIVWDSSRTI
jgi:hypothetical protein